MASNYYKIRQEPSSNFSELLTGHLDKFTKAVISMDIKIDQKDLIIKLSSDLVSQINDCVKRIVQEEQKNVIVTLDRVFSKANAHLSYSDSRYKREKVMQTSLMYVPPIELSSGFKHETKIDKSSGEAIRKTIQTTFMFVSPIKTLTALFLNEEFEKLYIEYNLNKHDCQKGTYEHFCCGNIYQSHEFFKSNPLAIQIKLFVDDFEPCDALKSRAGKHKVTAYYMQIVNLPQKFLSKLSSIYLVALCDASDAKNEYANTDNVIEIIVKDLKDLESVGVETKSAKRLKGTLVGVQFDNLGGNILLGLNASFISKYYCRICIATKEECWHMLEEDIRKTRTIEDYNKCVEMATEGSAIDSKGIKNYCYLNELSHFHTMKNFYVDIMHDILEGVAALTLERLFKRMHQLKIATIEEIQHLVDCFHFGSLYKQSVPSKIKIERKNLGQSASQMHCLLLHIPFILFKFRDQVTCIWKPVEKLLQILQIVFSDKITETDINRLVQLIREHHTSFMETFDEHLRPKHHLLLHYSTVIRATGPIKNQCVMRMEAKHQYFKNIAQKTKNFINLKKSLANKHQEKLYMDGFTYNDEIIASKLTSPLRACDSFDDYESILKAEIPKETIENAVLIKSVKINGIKYRPGYLFKFNSNFSQIEYIVRSEGRFWCLCRSSYKPNTYDCFLNSFELNSLIDYHVIELNTSNVFVYELKCLKDKPYIIADTLEVFHTKL